MRLKLQNLLSHRLYYVRLYRDRLDSALTLREQTVAAKRLVHAERGVAEALVLYGKHAA